MRFAVLTVAFAALSPMICYAGMDDDILAPHHNERLRGPQNGAVEIRLGPYLPDVDSDPKLGGKTPFKDTFGTTPRVLVGFEVDWQAIRVPGWLSLGPGVGASYTTFGGKAFMADAPTQRSDDETSFSVVPMHGLAVLRFDALHEQLNVPVQLFAKGGLAAAYWSAGGPDGTYNIRGKEASGMTWGTHFAMGAALQLDVFDTLTAARFDESTGINHTYAFWEYSITTLNGLSSDPVMRLGNNTWNAGLAFEF